MIVFYLTSGFFGISVLYSTLNIYNSTYENNKYSNNTKTHIKVAVYTHTPKKHTNTINSNFKTQPINKISPFYASTFSLCKLISMFVVHLFIWLSKQKMPSVFCRNKLFYCCFSFLASEDWALADGRFRPRSKFISGLGSSNTRSVIQGRPSFIHSWDKIGLQIDRLCCLSQSFRHDKDKILMFPSSVGSLLVSNWRRRSWTQRSQLFLLQSTSTTTRNTWVCDVMWSLTL